MRNPRQNTLVIFFSCLHDLIKKIIEGLNFLFFGKIGSSKGIIMGLLHHIFFTGPRRWKEHPTGIALGKAIFIPFVFLFSQKGSSGDSLRK